MHKGVKQRLEEYLRGITDQSALGEFRGHLDACESCRREVQAMEEHANLLRLLSAPDEIEPRAGFYGRVVTAIEAGRGRSLWLAFLEPEFGRRLVFASLATVLILGSYLVYTEQAAGPGASGLVGIMATDPPDYRHVGSDPQRDRETVLLSLASYQE
jgi:anti-sigma factor RsiW